MAYLLARYVAWLAGERQRPLRIFIFIMSVIGILMTCIFIIVRMDLVPSTIFTGKHVAVKVLMLRSLVTSDLNVLEWFLGLLPMILGICLLVWMEIKRNSLWAHELLVAMFLPVFALYFTLDGVVLPRLLAPQSDKEVGEYIMHHYPNQQLYSYIESRMMHFFCLNFYANNRIRQFDLDQPQSGILLISEGEINKWMKKYPTYQFKLIAKTQRKRTETKDIILFIQFEKR